MVEQRDVFRCRRFLERLDIGEQIRGLLIRNNSFIYDQDVWRGSIGGEGFLAGLDIASVVNRYLAAYPNVKQWLGRMKALKSWKQVNEVIDSYAATLKGQPMLAV